MCLTVFLSDTPTFKRLQSWLEAVGIMARGRASPGLMPWESWSEAVRALARGRRARGIFPGPNPSQPQVVHDVASQRQIISFLLANSHCCSRSRMADSTPLAGSRLYPIAQPLQSLAVQGVVGLNPWARVVAIVLFISLSIAISPIHSAWGLSSRFIAFRRGICVSLLLGPRRRRLARGRRPQQRTLGRWPKRRTPSCPCPR